MRDLKIINKNPIRRKVYKNDNEKQRQKLQSMYERETVDYRI